MLHIACSLGDKYFTTMIIEEAKEIGHLNLLIEEKDHRKMTPLYLLCEFGFRGNYNNKSNSDFKKE